MRNLNECIDSKAFASLILDSEYPEDKEFGLPAVVYCRVLIEDCWAADLSAKNREEAIEIFRSGAWRQ